MKSSFKFNTQNAADMCRVIVMTQYVTLKDSEKLRLNADVLLIEDEPLVSALIKRYLSSMRASDAASPGLGADYNIIALESGFDLLKTDLSNVKVAIVDILLPQVTGVDLIKDFRKRFPNMGILAISGMATDPMKRAVKDVLPEELKFLNKPLRKDEFYDAFLRAWKFFDTSSKKSEQQRLASPLLPKEENEELWTAVKVNETTSAKIAVEKRMLSRKKVAA